MRFWTVHVRPSAEPVLVREGFSWPALLFGPLWFCAERAWVPAALAFAAGVLVGVLAPAGARPALWIALAVAQGVFGRDLLRWSLERRGYVLAHVVAARDAYGALGRLLHGRPDLAEPLAADAGLR